MAIRCMRACDPAPRRHPRSAAPDRDERFGADRTVFGVEPNRFVAEHLAGLRPGMVLDLGAGQGRNAVWLAGQGHRVTAVDLSPVAGDQTREGAVAAGLTSRWSPQT